MVMAALLMTCVGSCISVFAVVLYLFHKAVEAFLLFSRKKRLADGVVGETLRALQVSELSSAAVVVWRTVSDKTYAKRLNEAMYGNHIGVRGRSGAGS